jgi:proline dehydrogenase
MILHALPKAAFAMLADSEILRRLAGRYGIGRSPHRARRLVAGETIYDAQDAAALLERRGFLVAFDYLEPAPMSTAAALEATRRYVDVVTRIAAGDHPRVLILKLTQIGLCVDRATALDNLRRVLDAAALEQMLIRLAADRASSVDASLDIADTLWQIGYRNLGISVSAALHRSPQDITRFVALGVSIRVIRAAAREPREVAHRSARDIGRAFCSLTDHLLREGSHPVFATHDRSLLEHVDRVAGRHGVDPSAYEMQMRRGVRTDLQTSLRTRGRRVRVRLPFGHEWFPYVMRQFGNRPGILFRG